MTTGYGAAAYEVLRRTVAEVKRDDPLAPVTLVVPTNLCGLVARRMLARGYGSAHRGIAGLAVATLPRLAELIAAPTLTGQGRRPVTGPILAAAWRRALAEDPGPFEPVATHPSTVRALVQAHRTLRDLSVPALAEVAAATALAGHMVRLHQRVCDRLADRWYDTTDLLRAAIEAAGERITSSVGTAVLFLPQDLDQASAGFARALAESTRVIVIAGLTGAARADGAVRRSLERLGLDQTDASAVDGQATAARIVHASDADDEVRCVVREVVDTLTATPAHRVAVLYGSADPYARLLHEHLASAGVAVNGVGVRPTHEHALARGLLDLLDLPAHGLRRDDLFRLLADAPVRDANGDRVPVSRWERISRSAGVVRGEDWDTRLRLYVEEERAAADRERGAEDASEGLIARHVRDADAAEQLRSFVTDLAARLAEGAGARTWRDLAPWALGLFHGLFGDEAALSRLPEQEARAAVRVEQVLTGLQGLDDIEPSADLQALRQVVELELADTLPRLGRFGEGVLVAPISSAVGLDADVVFVLGLAEDLYPGRHHEDALLPDRVRLAAAGELPASRDRLDREHRQLLAAFAAAPVVVASFPRGDLRRHSHRLPSRWLLPALRRLSGDRELAGTGWDTVPPGGWLVGSPSYAGSLVVTDAPSTEQEWRLRTLTAGAAIDDPVLAAAEAMIRARASSAFTRYDGNLAGFALPDIADGRRVVSPTALEAWASCPHAYFVQRLLRVFPVEAPEELMEISPLTVGTLVHEAFDAFVKAVGDAAPRPGEGWTGDQRRQLLTIAETRAQELQRHGLVGHPRLWAQEWTRIRADLAWLLDADDLWRAERQATLLCSEMTFGMDGEPAVEVPISGGRTIRFRGSADRVDLAADGTLVVVDLKTGSTRRYKGLDRDPVLGGTKLQLPVYAYAARRRYGNAATPVEAAYWFVRKDRGARIDVHLTPEVERLYADTLAVIADSIARGLFPHRPPETPGWGFVECPYCDPDGAGHKDARTRWERKRHDPALEAYVRLAEPDALVETALEGQR
ncbi:PD-(D/E)XK nuclease family protein [Actinopolymorpha sp. B9G3]|uniref:PD-(D/E)XK nuclease family protein n=1 Tax=Actinopolymorpha sp. B9G3 TaxID=3158970 RepID=UPI0032D943E1